MSYMDRATAVLRSAEKDLRSLITEAVTGEAYKDVASLARTTDALSHLIREVSTEVEPVGQPSIATVTLFGPEWPESVRASTADTGSVLLKPRLPLRRDQYPIFMREGSRLVKMAWSKKERRPYEHRAPREAIQILITAIQKKKGEGKLFQASDVMPLKDALYQDLPSYQSYLALAWLREVGVIAKKGREGYMLKAKTSTPEKLEHLWAALPEAESTDTPA